MIAEPRRRRGRPPKIGRDVAVWIAHSWFEEAEGLSAFNACEATRDLWVQRGFAGLGGPHSHTNRAIYPILRRAARLLGPGSVLTWPGRQFADGIFGRGATFVPATSRIHRDGRVIMVDGPFWTWIFGRELAELYEQCRAVEKATEIKVRAECRAGEMLAQAAAEGHRATAAGNVNQYARVSTASTPSVATLADLGITRDQSSRYQRLVAMPKADFEAAVAHPMSLSVGV